MARKAGPRGREEEQTRKQTAERATVKEKRSARPKKRINVFGILVAVAAIVVIALYAPKALENLKRIRNGEEMHLPGTESGTSGKVEDVPAAGKDIVEKPIATAVEKAPGPEAPAKAVILEPSPEYLETVKLARQKFEVASFNEAAENYLKASSLPAPEDKIEKVKEIAEACSVFDEITRGVKPSVTADASGLHWLKLKTGRRMMVRVDKKTAEKVEYQKDGISGELQMDIIDELTPISQEERDREMRDEFGKMKIKADTSSSLSTYELALQALKFNFKKDAAELLREAWKQDPNLRATVREHWATRLFKQGAWFHGLGLTAKARQKFDLLAQTYPETNAAKIAAEVLDEAEKREAELLAQRSAKAQELARKREEEQRRKAELEANKQDDAEAAGPMVVVVDDGDDDVEVSTGGIQTKDMASIKKAQADYSEGMKYMNEAKTAAQKRSNECYKKAQKLLENAVNAYDKALKQDPGNVDIEDALQKAGMNLYWSKKLQRMG